jgi:hypothetical protein
MNPEVLIYINKVKEYIQKNDEAYEYFLGNMDIDFFFENVYKVAELNYEKKGDATLSKEQFEDIKKLKPTTQPPVNGIFMDIPNFGQICLN